MKKWLLVMDTGNTHTVVGLFDGQKLGFHWRLDTKKERTADEWGIFLKELLQFENISFKQIADVVLSNVVPPIERAVREMAKKYLKKGLLVINAQSPLGLKIAVDNPLEVGADRIVNALSATQKYSLPLIVVDFGTATTFDYIDQNKAYCGGVITPGMIISADALFSQTSQLPRVDFTKPNHVIGTNTISCIQSGLYHGYVGMVDSIVNQMEKEIQHKAFVVATGGLASLIAKDSQTIDTVDEFLTLNGLMYGYFALKEKKK